MKTTLTLRTAGAKPLAVLSAVLCAVFLAFLVWTVSDGQFSIFPALGAVGTALMTVRGTVGSKVTVEGGSLAFLHGFRMRRIPVQDVAEVSVRTGSGLRRTFIVLADGKKLPLPAPGGWWPSQDPDFDQNVSRLEQALGLTGPRDA